MPADESACQRPRADSHHSRAAEDATADEKPLPTKRRYAASRAFFARGGLRLSKDTARAISLSWPDSAASTYDSTVDASIPCEASSLAMPAQPLPAAMRLRTRTSAKRPSSTNPHSTARATAFAATSSGKPSRIKRSSNDELDRSRTEQRRSIFRIAAS